MMPTMKREQFEAMDFEELLEWAYENVDNLWSEEGLKEMAKHEIDEDSFQMALHILNAIYESDCPDGSYYLYDRSMGTLEIPTPITCKEDLEDLIDFGDEEDFVSDDDRPEMPWDYGRHFDDKDEEEADPQDHDDETNWETQLRCR